MQAAFLLLAAGVAVVASPAAGPLGRTASLVADLRAVVTPGLRSAPLDEAARRANAAAFARLDGYFDLDRVVADSIAPYRRRLSPEQLTRFAADFREVVRLVAYSRAAEAFGSKPCRVDAGAVRGDGADTSVALATGTGLAPVRIVFHWGLRRGAWRIHDVSYDGGSLVASYRRQLGRLLQEGPPEHLLARIARRLSEERRAGLVPPRRPTDP